MDYKYRLKDVVPPRKYLGAKVGKQTLSDGSLAWYMSAGEYLKKALPELERKFGNIVNLFGKSLQFLIVFQTKGQLKFLNNSTSNFLDK